MACYYLFRSVHFILFIPLLCVPLMACVNLCSVNTPGAAAATLLTLTPLSPTGPGPPAVIRRVKPAVAAAALFALPLHVCLSAVRRLHMRRSSSCHQEGLDDNYAELLKSKVENH